MSLLKQQLKSIQKQNITQQAPGFAAFEGIVDQQAIDAAFLWLQRSQVVSTSTLYTAEDITELEHRIAGHLQGLLSAGPLGWTICLDQLELEEAGETFVAAVIAFLSSDTNKLKRVCERARDNTEMSKGLISAFGWISEATAQQWIERFLLVKDSYYRYLGVAACSIRRIDPEQQLIRLFQEQEILEQDIQLHARCLRLVGELKRHDLVPALNQAMNAEDETVKFWAYWSAALLGNQVAAHKMGTYVLGNEEFQDRALSMLFNSLSIEQAREWLSGISREPSNLRTVIKAAAIVGDTEVMPWLIQQMHDPIQARIAGLSFSLMTGIDLEASSFSKDVVIEFEDNPEGEIEDDAESEDSELAWPDPIRIRSFWDKNVASFEPHTRYFMGQPVEAENLQSVLNTGNQRQRSDAALKLAVLESDTILHNTAVPSVKL